MTLAYMSRGECSYKYAYSLCVSIGEKIGRNLLRYLVENDVTEGEAAARAGLAQPSISNLVTGKTVEPKLSTLFALTTLPGLTLEVLLAGVDVARRPNKARGAHLKRLLESGEDA